MEKILIVKLRALGDVVLSTIILDNIRDAYPQARIDFLTEDSCKEVVLGNPILNSVLVFERKEMERLGSVKKCIANLKFIKMIRNQNYDLVFDFFGNPRSALMTYLSGAKERVGYDFRCRQQAYTKVVPSRANVVHEAEWHLDALTHLNIPVVSRKLNFEVGEGSKNFANNFWQQTELTGKRVIALNFSGGWPAKRWPTDRFAHLADILMELYSARIILIWGPGEREAAERVQEQVVGPTLLIPEANLKQLAAILQRADILITTDSGPMHVAAAMGTPCVALFGPTNANLQGPYGSYHKVVKAEQLDCLGCNRLQCGHLSCMNFITVSDVLTAVKQSISENDLFTSLT